ncbi:hypothetical protein EDB92DRAFT_1801144 [Lactarius akahatsu]|uniref:Uncharacterized protein n=1 Tax=Lactarius akahatsu TaxID=416441 RepID=A0AAD4QBU9_9AGAM|nr:hypothetical protein EDB92DRAFT_1801144 [Lactarius akahatsu]
MEKKERKQKTHAQQIRRADIARHYDRLVERKSHPILPTLAEFRGLPIIKALQDRVKISQVLKSELKRPQLIGGMINSDLKQWADTALREFDAILGQPNWKRASTKFLHPSERVNARFICTLCHRTPKGHTAPVSLDLREACAHECAGHHRKAAAKKKPKADQFVPDQKVHVNSPSRALILVGLRAEHRETESEVNSIGARFLCKSCNSPTVMDFWRLVSVVLLFGFPRPPDPSALRLGIAAGTIKWKLRWLSTAEAVAMTAGHQYDAGSFALYTARTDEANRIGQTKTFGCRHCPHEILKSTRARRSQKSGDRGERRFTFNGLVSHAKEKCVSNFFLP